MVLSGVKAKLLVVDNEQDQLVAMVSLLRSAGYEVLEAINGAEALDQVRENHPDLIILDKVLPDKDGLELGKEIKSEEELQDTLVILLSQLKISPENRSKWLEEGVDGCLTKPISKGELLAIVESMLRLKESESKYKSIFENTGTATIIVGEDKTISLANSEFEQLSGYSKEEIEGRKKWTEFVPEENLDKMMKYHDLRRNNPDSAPRNYEIKFKDKNKHLKDIFITVGMIYGTDKSVVSLLDITERKKTEKALSRELKINSDLAILSSKLLESTPIEDISDLVLKYAQSFTRSEFGFVGYIDPETGFLISPTMTRNIWTECHVKDKSVIFEKFGGLWGWVLNNKQPILTNQPNDDPRSTGTPTGHIAIETFLAVPAIVNEDLVGLISLANSNEYNENDLEIVKRLSDLYAIAITRKHSDDALRKNEEKYRNIVEKFLKLHNEILIEIIRKDEL
ncbi:MAG: response regulator [Methanobacterium sp.]|jgi:PAS domain S-box-containing protein|uniref:GAF domain-containing protein n=1 Tax=Methanobacterium sp. TaxID=2164 RepID=UPI00258D8D88|nr:GAF domain-containing protein [Methanobacterium sp.]MCC7560361.1 response regulator [Methanobacterium sp.]